MQGIWNPEKMAARRPLLERRAKLIQTVRSYFDAQGFLEVETPILQTCPVIDAHIRAFGTDLRGVDGQIARTVYLHTSPEFAMKKLMVGGLEKIYQICHVFRNAEDSARHSPEFTMIEWYRTHADYSDIMMDCEGLLRTCATALGIKTYRYKDMICDPFTPWEYISVADAFKKYAGIDLLCFLPEEENTDRFRQAVANIGLHTAPDDRWDDLFFRVMAEKIEPFLGMRAPTFLYDYPVSMASLSRRKPEDPRLAERFELYVCGIELANAFSELTDAAEQRARYHEEMTIKERLYGERYPLDEDFIAALEHGLPPSGGIALGIDRLVMLATGAEDIAQILWAGRP